MVSALGFFLVDLVNELLDLVLIGSLELHVLESQLLSLGCQLLCVVALTFIPEQLGLKQRRQLWDLEILAVLSLFKQSWLLGLE